MDINKRESKSVKQTGRQFRDELLGWANYLLVGSDSTRWGMSGMRWAPTARSFFRAYPVRRDAWDSIDSEDDIWYRTGLVRYERINNSLKRIDNYEKGLFNDSFDSSSSVTSPLEASKPASAINACLHIIYFIPKSLWIHSYINFLATRIIPPVNAQSFN